jgi:hypothetical protein
LVMCMCLFCVVLCLGRGLATSCSLPGRWNRFTRQTLPSVNKEYFFTNILCIDSFCPQKENAPQNAALRYYTPQAQSPFWLLKPASEHGHARLLTWLSWSWTVLLPSDTYRKPITSITAVSFPFVTYLLTLPRMIYFSSNKRDYIPAVMRSLCLESRKNSHGWIR